MKTPTKPKKKPLIKTCNSCGKVGPHNWMNSNNAYRYRCQTCHNEYNRQYRKTDKYKQMHSKNEIKRRLPRKHARRNYLIDLLGGKCKICGLKDDCPDVYDFHHRDPKLKKLMLSGYSLTSTSLPKIIKEARKCDLLCANCHRKLHWQLRQ